MNLSPLTTVSPYLNITIIDDVHYVVDNVPHAEKDSALTTLSNIEKVLRWNLKSTQNLTRKDLKIKAKLIRNNFHIKYFGADYYQKAFTIFRFSAINTMYLKILNLTQTSTFPQEIWQTICEWLNVKELMKLGKVSAQLNKISKMSLEKQHLTFYFHWAISQKKYFLVDNLLADPKQKEELLKSKSPLNVKIGKFNYEKDALHEAIDYPGRHSSFKFFQLIKSQSTYSQSDVDMVGFLLSRGADPNTTNAIGSTPLLIAAINGDLTLTKLLLFNGADPNKFNSGGISPLHYAARKGYLEIVNELLSCGAKPNLIDKGLFTPLANAAIYRHLKIVKILLLCGAKWDIVELDDEVKFWLREQVLRKSSKVINPQVMDSEAAENQTILFSAAYRGDCTSLERLLKKKVDINTLNSKGESALQIAIENKHENFINSIMEHET